MAGYLVAVAQFG